MGAPALDQALALVLALDQVAVLVSLNCAQEFLKSPSLQLAITTLAQSSPLFTISTCKMSKSTTTEEHYMCQLLVSPSIGKWLVRLKIMPRNLLLRISSCTKMLQPEETKERTWL